MKKVLLQCAETECHYHGTDGYCQREKVHLVVSYAAVSCVDVITDKQYQKQKAEAKE